MGTFLDFLEIGTSDFDTLVQKAKPGDKGMSIDAVGYYLDRLPSPPGWRKLNLGISDAAGELSLHYLHPDDIAAHGLPSWLRGCNSIGTPHPTAARLVEKAGLPATLIRNESVRVEKLITVLQDHDISGIHLLKVDTEGHDTVILSSFFDDCTPNLFPHELIFESNSLSDSDALHRLIAKLILLGYEIISCRTDRGDSDTHLRLNIRRVAARTRFTEAISGYYLLGYPKGYDYANPPHANTLDAAMDYCRKTGMGGVTHQYDRYEVREGRYLKRDPAAPHVTSWVMIGQD